METLTWDQFSALPPNLHVCGEVVFKHGPDYADIHHPLRKASVAYILCHVSKFDSIRLDIPLTQLTPTHTF